MLAEETTALGIPCITSRENNERPITVEEGSNTLAGTDPVHITDVVPRKILNNPGNHATGLSCEKEMQLKELFHFSFRIK